VLDMTLFYGNAEYFQSIPYSQARTRGMKSAFRIKEELIHELHRRIQIISRWSPETRRW